MSSGKLTLCWAIQCLERGILSLSLVRPCRDYILVFFPHVVPSARKGANLLLSDKVQTRFCLQFSKLFIESFSKRLHCFGALGDEAMTVVVYWVYERIKLE